MQMLSRSPLPHFDRVFVHQLNLTSADILKKEREKREMEQETEKLVEWQEMKRKQKEEEKKRDMEMLMSYNPWGKPGGGAPKKDVKRQRFEGEPEESESESEDETKVDFNKKFGRPGGGAPIRTKSGNLKTQLTGDPIIRFQDTQQVRRSIENHLRYKNEDKENYSRNLENLIQEKLSLKEKEKERDKQLTDEMTELYPFGRQSDNEPVFMYTKSKRRPMLKEDFDPWGKGYGNPARDDEGNVQRYKFSRTSEGGIETPSNEDESRLALPLNVGRVKGGGAGAPIRTDSGSPRTRLPKTLYNIKSMGAHIKEITEDDGYCNDHEPWGKPGAGAPFERTYSKHFEEKMGWSLTGHPKRRTRDAKKEYMATLKQEIEDRRMREEEEKVNNMKVGAELASVIRQGGCGRPIKDPQTGELSRNPIKLTDVTSQYLDIRRVKSQESLRYHDELSRQAAEREQRRERQRELERAQSTKHMHTWESLWGRPGHGAPQGKDSHRKENLDSQLLKPSSDVEPYVKQYVAEIALSKHKNRYEYPSTGNQVRKRQFEFRTPYPATEVK